MSDNGKKNIDDIVSSIVAVIESVYRSTRGKEADGAENNTPASAVRGKPAARQESRGEKEEKTPSTPEEWISLACGAARREAEYLRTLDPELQMSVTKEGHLQKPIRVNGFVFMIKLNKNFPLSEKESVFPLTVYLVMPNKREYMERFGVESLPGVTEDENGLECLDFGGREAARCAENETLVSEEAINFIKSWLASLRVLGVKRKTDSGSAPVSGKTRPKYVDARGKTGGRANPKCKKIVLSDRAYAQILSETYSRIKTETGGLLLGHYENGVWYVAEATDPGINAKFTVAYHEGDEVYENHVAGVISRLYKHPLVFLGMWHRHPGSMDVFSGTDDGTNYKYAASAGNGCISALVNVDPDFRMTFYYAERDERTRSVYYTKVDVEVGDSRFENREILRYASEEELIGRMARR